MAQSCFEYSPSPRLTRTWLVRTLLDAGIRSGMFFFVLRHLVCRDDRHGGVVHPSPVAGEHLGRLYPLIFREVGGYVNIFILVLAGATHGKFGNGENYVRLDVPSFGKSR